MFLKIRWYWYSKPILWMVMFILSYIIMTHFLYETISTDFQNFWSIYMFSNWGLNMILIGLIIDKHRLKPIPK